MKQTKLFEEFNETHNGVVSFRAICVVSGQYTCRLFKQVLWVYLNIKKYFLRD
jgi:hypothetical protein